MKVASLLFIIVLPFAVYAAVSRTDVTRRRSSTSARRGRASWLGVNWALFGAALVGVLWAYHGWMNIAPVAEEVKNPQRNIPLALLAGVLILIVLYCGANVGLLPRHPARPRWTELKDTTVATEFCLRLLGPVGAIIASAIVMTSVFGALNGNLLVGPRLLYAMGQDRLAPARLSRVAPALPDAAAGHGRCSPGGRACWCCASARSTQYRLPAFRSGSPTST